MQEPTLSMLQPPSATESFRKCETGCVKNLHRYNLQFFRKLIEKDEFYLKSTYSHTQRGKFFQRYDKLFVANGRDVHSLRADKIDESTRLYSIAQHTRNMKLTESRVLAAKAQIFTSTLLPQSQYRPILFILNDKNTLLHIDFETGELISSIYLGSLERCKFNYIGWERYLNTILIQSTDSMAKTGGRVISYNIIMSIWPLKFVACFEIETCIFKKQKSANISDGVLILSNPKPPDQLVNFYSLQDILDPDNFKCRTDIDEICVSHLCDECSRTDTRIVGRNGHGFPVNIVMKSKPRLLMSILTCYPSIKFGGNPFHVIYSPPGQRDTFHVERIEGRVSVINGSITFDNYLEEHNDVVFHDDPLDNRIIAVDSHKLTFYKIVNNILIRLGELSPTPPTYFNKLPSRLVTSKKTRKNDNMDRSILSYASEDETEIFFVLGVDLSSHRRSSPVMCLFDNFNGMLLKKFNLKFRADEANEYGIWADLDLIFINEHNPFGPSKVMCYRLERLPDNGL